MVKFEDDHKSAGNKLLPKYETAIQHLFLSQYISSRYPSSLSCTIRDHLIEKIQQSIKETLDLK
jgi:hypothetical protein